MFQNVENLGEFWRLRLSMRHVGARDIVDSDVQRYLPIMYEAQHSSVLSGAARAADSFQSASTTAWPLRAAGKSIYARKRTLEQSPLKRIDKDDVELVLIKYKDFQVRGPEKAQPGVLCEALQEGCLAFNEWMNQAKGRAERRLRVDEPGCLAVASATLRWKSATTRKRWTRCR